MCFSFRFAKNFTTTSLIFERKELNAIRITMAIGRVYLMSVIASPWALNTQIITTDIMVAWTGANLAMDGFAPNVSKDSWWMSGTCVFARKPLRNPLVPSSNQKKKKVSFLNLTCLRISNLESRLKKKAAWKKVNFQNGHILNFLMVNSLPCQGSIASFFKKTICSTW